MFERSDRSLRGAGARFFSDVDGLEYDNLFIFDEVGWNFEPSEASAAFGLVQLRKLPAFLETRQRNFARLHAQNAGIGALQDVEHGARRALQRPRRGALDEHAVPPGADRLQRRCQARRNRAAGFVRDERHAIIGSNAEADFNGVARAGR